MRERERRQRRRRGEGIVMGERTYMEDVKAEMSMACSSYTDHQHPWLEWRVHAKISSSERGASSSQCQAKATGLSIKAGVVT